MGRESPWARGGLKWTHEGGIGGVVKADVSINRSVHWKWRIGEMENYTREIEGKWDREKWETRWNIERICTYVYLAHFVSRDHSSEDWVSCTRSFNNSTVKEFQNRPEILSLLLSLTKLRNCNFRNAMSSNLFFFFFSFGISKNSREFETWDRN